VPGSAYDVTRGLQALREAVACALFGNLLDPDGGVQPAYVLAGDAARRPPPGAPPPLGWLLSEVVANDVTADGTGHGPGADGFGDSDQAASSEETEEERTRLIALVELARTGDADAFGMLYDHYQGSVYRFLFYRTRSSTLAEDLTSETFFRALRNMQNFRWQGKDFGAWLMTIARNLATDHFKAGRTRLEMATEDMGVHDDATEGPETAVLASLTNELLLKALTELPAEQKDCLIMRFLQGMSIAETAAVLGRSEGAVKQLQLRGVRNLAKLMPEGIR
jgi:RNA polymerase sigma-70 factor, ECF subfamily